MPLSSKKMRDSLSGDFSTKDSFMRQTPEREYELPKEDSAFIPAKEWSNFQEVKKYKLPQAQDDASPEYALNPEDDFIPVKEWSTVQQVEKHELSPEGAIFVPVKEWSKYQEIKKYNLTGEKDNDIPECSCDPGDSFIPVKEWSSFQEINKHVLPQENDETVTEYSLTSEHDAIPVHEWSQVQDINKKEKLISDERISGAIETLEDKLINCPYCAREMKSDDTKCRYCHRTIDKRRNRRIGI